jgi:diaminohydroxyphosphoribosylaminopyrimidine deaminase/5-amino-6-(5-phosphoribosylamino)uracil reductase
MASGESQWITGDAARRDVQRLRARSSAILTGVATVLHDDPRLSVRLPAGAWIQPLRVVLDSELRMTPDARVLHEPGATLVFTASRPGRSARMRCAGPAPRSSGVRVRSAGSRSSPSSPALARRGVNDVLVEAARR